MSLKYSQAISIIKRFRDHGYEAYIVGGWVRDKLLGIVDENGDIDIATNCLIQDISKIFSDCIFVGMVFGTCIVKIKSNDKYFQYDVATFRLDGVYEDGRHPTYIKTTSLEKDAKRRDLTINALYYDPLEDKIYDFVGGQKDLSNKIIRTVGSPFKRFREDKLRMLRVVRFSAKFGFQIESKVVETIKKLSNKLLSSVSYERIWQEVDKMSRLPNFEDAFLKLKDFGLLMRFFPELDIDNNVFQRRLNKIILLPRNTPTLIKIMILLDTFDKNKTLEIVRRFNIRVPNWI